jgi:hypothetical protein
MLDELAPEAEVKSCGWYMPETNQLGQRVITRAQRIRYAVQAGLPVDFVRDTLLIDVQETISKFTKLVNRLSRAGSPPALPGDLKSLTDPGVHPENS